MRVELGSVQAFSRLQKKWERDISWAGYWWESKAKEIELWGEFAIERGREKRAESKREVIRADGVEITGRLNGGT